MPPLAQPGWTLLVQGLDLHLQAAHELLSRFRFVPDARLDDLMLSYASDGGGVGPHLDSYDVFLIQVHGRRRWRIGRAKDRSLVDGLPLKILRHFEPEHEWLLEPGDMLYLPPLWAHDGVAVGECMTASVGFRAPATGRTGARAARAAGAGVEPAARERLYARCRRRTATPAPAPSRRRCRPLPRQGAAGGAARPAGAGSVPGRMADRAEGAGLVRRAGAARRRCTAAWCWTGARA